MWFKKVKQAQTVKSTKTIQFDENEQKIIDFVRKVSRLTGTTARIAGGFVRDKLLGVPSKDIDITLDNVTGVQFAKACFEVSKQDSQTNGQITEPVANERDDPRVQALGTTYLWMFGYPIDLVSLRKEDYPDPTSRVPVIVPATASEDALRRDLTINSIFYNISNDSIEDLTPRKTCIQDLGFDELGNKVGPIVLRTPRPDSKGTFMEDPTRVLRVMRFYSRYPDAIVAPEVKEAMHDKEVQQKLFENVWSGDKKVNKPVSNEMLGKEFLKMMQGKRADKAITLMDELGVLEPLMGVNPKFDQWEMDQKNPHHELTVKQHTFTVLRNANALADEYGLSPELRQALNVAALWHDIGKRDPRSHVLKPNGQVGYHGFPNQNRGDKLREGVQYGIAHEKSSAEQFENFALNLKFSNEDRDIISELISKHMAPHKLHDATDKQLRKFYRENQNIWKLMQILGMADSMSKKQNPEEGVDAPYRKNIDLLGKIEQQPYAQTLTSKKGLVDGKEIMQMFPQIPPKTGFIKLLLDFQMNCLDENPYINKEEMIQRIRTEAPTLLGDLLKKTY